MIHERRLGRTGLSVSEVGYGAWGIGGDMWLGAQGLMQITPATAQMIARKSGGVAFTVEDLGTPQVNIAYGSWYLRYLMGRYAGNRTFALAAYNGGEGNVDRWISEARARDEDLTIAAIPFSETRTYVQRVLDAQRQYRTSYARELGL